jgi:tRNA1Val (adenine37-N6)-methyltransferase
MKVCTDSCLFGALIEANNHQLALDIGTGTGLLSLMIAQKNENLKITALEIDGNAIIDASANIKNSIYGSQIQLIHQSLQDYTPTAKDSFDLIFTNPPFYQNNLKSDKTSKNIAHHADTLTFNDLADSLEKLLSENGTIWVLLPPFEMQKFLEISEQKGLFEVKKYLVKHNESKPVFREIVVLQRTKTHSSEISTINIYENHQYSPIFVELLKEYYLIF